MDQEAIKLIAELLGEVEYLHETADINDSIKNSADLKERAKKFLADNGYKYED